jgi:hypothetical protein
LKRISDNELIYYSEKSMPWPVTSRDAVMKIKVNLDAATGNMVVNVKPVSGLVPVKKDLVLVSSSEVSWRVTPIDKNNMQMTYEAKVDPGGSLPSWVTNMVLSKGPFESFKKLRDMMDKMYQ